MSNPHSKGKLAHPYPASVIDKMGVGNFVVECYNRGMSYREISQALWEKHSVKVSKMAISRYILRGRNEFRPTQVATSLGTLRDSVIQKNISTYDDLGKIFEEIRTLIEVSNLSAREKISINKSIDYKKKRVVNKYTESQADIGLIFENFEKHSDQITKLLVEFSGALCVECRVKVSKFIKEYEDSR